MKLKLERTGYGEVSTIGDLSINGAHFCWTLEDKDRALETSPEAKVLGKTAIPKGKYDVVIDYSQRFKCAMPHVLKVPGFMGIRIHPGNTSKDTEGCILVGGKPLNNDFIPKSRQHYSQLFELMQQAEDHGEVITLEVC